MNTTTMIRTLIVDDEPIARQTLKDYCALEGDIEVVGECRYGAEAVKRIAALHPDLVFLDVQMRRVNGLEVIDKIGRDGVANELAARGIDTGSAHALLDMTGGAASDDPAHDVAALAQKLGPLSDAAAENLGAVLACAAGTKAGPRLRFAPERALAPLDEIYAWLGLQAPAPVVGLRAAA